MFGPGLSVERVTASKDEEGCVEAVLRVDQQYAVKCNAGGAARTICEAGVIE